MLRGQFVSYPKSGRTWLRFALHQLGADDHILFHHDTFEFNDGRLPPPDLDFERRLERCRAAGPTVYLTRDPRDILVSLYHQVTGRFGEFFDYRGTLSEFIRDDYFGARHLKIFREQWRDICRRGLALEIRYEDCHRDLPSVLRTILAHYDVPVTDADISNAVEQASFANMRQVEASGEFPHVWLRPRKGGLKVRRGMAGGHRMELSDADIEYLDAMFELEPPR